jgi:biopolymer transport protein ExbB
MHLEGRCKEVEMMISNKWFLWVVTFVGFFVCVDAMAAPPVEEAEVVKESMFALIRKGGPVMFPLAIGSILALALGIERFLSLRKEKIIPPAFMTLLVEAWNGDSSGEQAVKYCEQTDGPAGHIFKAGLLRIKKGEDAVEKAIEDAGYREADKMKRSLRGLSVIASVSPLLGLLGTVYGMIAAFQTASSVGMGKADILAKGIYEALVTTAAGLTIAIPVLLVYQFLSNRVDAIVDELDEMGMEFMATCSKNDDK